MIRMALRKSSLILAGCTIVFAFLSCLEEEGNSSSAASLTGPSKVTVTRLDAGEKMQAMPFESKLLASVEPDHTLILDGDGRFQFTEAELALKFEEARLQLTQLMQSRSQLEFRLVDLQAKIAERKALRKKMSEEMKRDLGGIEGLRFEER